MASQIVSNNPYVTAKEVAKANAVDPAVIAAEVEQTANAVALAKSSTPAAVQTTLTSRNTTLATTIKNTP